MADTLHIASRAREAWRQLLDSLPIGATYYVDDAIMDALQWTAPGGLPALIARRAPHNIKAMPDAEQFPASATPDSATVVFLVADLLSWTRSREKLASVLQSAPYRSCFVFSGLSELAHVTLEGRQAGLFSSCEEWIRGVHAKALPDADGDAPAGHATRPPRLQVRVAELPMVCAVLLDSFITAPMLGHLFPDDVDDRTADYAAHALSGILSQLPLSEEIYALGSTSRAIAERLVPIQRARRSSAQSADGRAAVVLVDRTLDAATPSLHSDCFLDRAFCSLPRRHATSSDVSFDTSILGAFGGPLLGTLAHGGDAQAAQWLRQWGAGKVKPAEMALRKALVELLSANVAGYRAPSRTVGANVTDTIRELLVQIARVPSLTAPSAAHAALEQIACCALAVHAAARDDVSTALLQSEGQRLCRDFSDDPAQVHAILRSLFDPAERARSPMLPALRDALTLAIAGFSLLGDVAGQAEAGGDDDERRFKEFLLDALVGVGVGGGEADAPPAALSPQARALGWVPPPAAAPATAGSGGKRTSAAIALRQFRLEVADCVDDTLLRLRRVRAARADESVPRGPLRRLCVDGEFVPLLRTLTAALLRGAPADVGLAPAQAPGARQAAPVESAPSALFRSLIGGMAPAQTEHFKHIIIIVIGGTTFTEWRHIQQAAQQYDDEVARESAGAPTPSPRAAAITLIGTCVTSPERMYEQVMCAGRAQYA